MPETLSAESINDLIHVIRGQRVMIDADLARFYGVPTKVLNQAVRRNLHRFPDDFSFLLEAEDFASLRSQIVTSNIGRGGRRYRLRVFTEHGAVMLASVLNSATAIAASVEVVRAFVRLRKTVALSGTDLIARLVEMEKRIGGHEDDIAQLFDAIRLLLAEPRPSPNKEPEMGFHAREDEPSATSPRPRTKKAVNYKTLRRKPARHH